MKILSALIVGLIAFGISTAVGEWLLGILRNTGGVITAGEIVGLQYVFPFFCGFCAFWLVYQILRSEK